MIVKIPALKSNRSVFKSHSMTYCKTLKPSEMQMPHCHVRAIVSNLQCCFKSHK